MNADAGVIDLKALLRSMHSANLLTVLSAAMDRHGLRPRDDGGRWLRDDAGEHWPPRYGGRTTTPGRKQVLRQSAHHVVNRTQTPPPRLPQRIFPPRPAPFAETDPPTLPAGWLLVESMDMDAQGVAHRPDGKAVSIDGALPGELVSAQIQAQKEQLGAGRAHRHPPRIVPARACAQAARHFGLHTGACGGCKMQHCT